MGYRGLAKLLLEMNPMRRSMWLTAVFLGVLGVSVLTGQSPAADGDGARDGFRFTTSVEAVHLTVTVTKKGKLVTNLKEKDFSVYEDGASQELTYFARGTDSPVDIALLVDASGSMDMVSKVVNTRNAAIQLIHSLDPQDRVAVYAFDKDLYEAIRFTEDKEEAIRKLQLIKPFGSTALYDAVARTSVEISDQGFGRRAIVVMTDGVDTSSEMSVDEAVQIAKGVDVPVYAVRVLSPVDDPSSDAFLGIHGREAKNQSALRQFSSATGGNLFEGSELGALRLIALRIREELKTQYRLGYVPTNKKKDGRFRRIDILTRRGGVEVHARRGYYARPKSGAEALLDASSNQEGFR